MCVDATIEVCSGGHGSKEEACQPCKMEKQSSGGKKKLSSQPRSQPFPTAGARMRRAPRTEEEETASGRSSPAAVLKGI